MELAGKTALVTGSSRGIGRAIALKLGEQGAAVIVNGRDSASLTQVSQEIAERGGQALAIVADISLSHQVQELMERAVSQWGKVDILVNNAGITRDQLLVRMKEEDWDEVLATNLKGAFLTTKAAIKYMLRERWGRIVNISSLAGLIGNPGQVNYASAKGGLIGFTKSLAKEVASRSITVNAIAPGFIDTDMTRSLSAPQREELLKRIPMGYIGSTDDVAEAVAFLASPQARYITGQVLCVDGGLGMA